jgi:hypothetical protein
MNRNKWILALVTLLMIGGTAGVLAKFKSIQRLGEPGVKTRPLPGSQNLEVVLPDRVLGFTSAMLPVEAIVTNVLPRDTSYGNCRYTSADTNFSAQVNVVLMGTDRASLHKPQFCLTGGGWTIRGTEVDPLKAGWSMLTGYLFIGTWPMTRSARPPAARTACGPSLVNLLPPGCCNAGPT